MTISTENYVRVLLVESDQETASMLRYQLSQRGFEVTLASNGDDALTLLDAHTFDVMVSDIQLYDGSGVELIQAVHEWHKIPAVAMSTLTAPSGIQELLSAGFAAHATQPVDLEILQSTLADLTRSTTRRQRENLKSR